MALNWGDVALNLTAGAIEKDEVYRKEALEQRFKDLQDNKQLYRALATTRYSKDLDKYYKETEKYDAVKSVYSEIGKGNMTKDAAMNKIIQADPQYSKAWAFAASLGDEEGDAEMKRIRNAVESNFKDKERSLEDGTVEKYWEFSHPEWKMNLPEQKDYFQDPNYWGNLAEEIKSETVGPLQKQLLKLMGKEPAEVDLDTLEQKAGTDIKKLMDNKNYSSTNMERTATVGGGVSSKKFIDNIPSTHNSMFNSRSGTPTSDVKKDLLGFYNAKAKGQVKFFSENKKGEVQATPDGQYVYNESKKLYQEVNDALWQEMIAKQNYSVYNDKDFSNWYEAEAHNRTVTMKNKGFKTGWQGDIKGFYVVPTHVVPLGHTTKSFWGVDMNAFSAHMDQWIANTDGNGKVLLGSLGNNKYALDAEALRWLNENKTIDPPTETEETETGEGDTTTGEGDTKTTGGITQEKLDGDNGINIIKGLSTNSGDSVQDIIADFEEEGFTISDDIKTVAVLVNAPTQRKVRVEGTKTQFEESPEWTEWATVQLPLWEKAISYLNTNYPEPERKAEGSKAGTNPDWKVWNKKWGIYFAEYTRIQEKLELEF